MVAAAGAPSAEDGSDERGISGVVVANGENAKHFVEASR